MEMTTEQAIEVIRSFHARMSLTMQEHQALSQAIKTVEEQCKPKQSE